VARILSGGRPSAHPLHQLDDAQLLRDRYRDRRHAPCKHVILPPGRPPVRSTRQHVQGSSTTADDAGLARNRADRARTLSATLKQRSHSTVPRGSACKASARPRASFPGSAQQVEGQPGSRLGPIPGERWRNASIKIGHRERGYGHRSLSTQPATSGQGYSSCP